MCLIIANFGEAKQVTKTVFNDAKKANPDGIGIMHCLNGKIKVKKFVTKVEQDSAFKYYLALRALRPAVNIVIHFRYATHGPVNAVNCHPFKVNSELYVCHNGILDIDQPNPLLSDTVHFVKNVLSVLPVGFEKLQAYKLLIESFIDYSKLAFLNSNGDIYLHNSNLGGYDGGNWYSNTRYKCSPKPTAFNDGGTQTSIGYNYTAGKFWHEGKSYDSWGEWNRAKNETEKKATYHDGTIDQDVNDIGAITAYKDKRTISSYKAQRETELQQEREAKKMERYINGQWSPATDDII